MTAACPATRKREREETRDTRGTAETPAGSQESKCPFKARKLDSPSDSGIDSPKAQGSHSTNTSLCSSPRSSLEDKVKEVEPEGPEVAVAPAAAPTGPGTLEEQHPLLKRALQQPPQPFNMGGVSGFQDEVYHKKFRHSGRKDSNEPTSTQESARSPSPVTAASAGHSILASQLAAPPSYTAGSVLASTLSRPVSRPGAKESEQRNEWLANLILERRQPPSQAGSLLMCAPAPAHSASPRHIPVPVAPTQPRQAPPPPPTSTQHNNEHLKMALSAASSNSSSSSSSTSTSDSQPLNLSTRTPPPADIPTEA